MSQAVIEHRQAARDKLNLAVVTVSDTRTLETDTSGALIVELAEEAGHRIVARHIVRDEPAEMTPSDCRAVRARGAGRDSGHGRNRDQPARPNL